MSLVSNEINFTQTGTNKFISQIGTPRKHTHDLLTGAHANQRVTKFVKLTDIEILVSFSFFI